MWSGDDSHRSSQENSEKRPTRSSDRALVPLPPARYVFKRLADERASAATESSPALLECKYVSSFQERIGSAGDMATKPWGSRKSRLAKSIAKDDKDEAWSRAVNDEASTNDWIFENFVVCYLAEGTEAPIAELLLTLLSDATCESGGGFNIIRIALSVQSSKMNGWTYTAAKKIMVPMWYVPGEAYNFSCQLGFGKEETRVAGFEASTACRRAGKEYRTVKGADTGQPETYQRDQERDPSIRCSC